MIKLVVFTPVWKRPEVTRIYIAGILRLQKQVKDFVIDCFCVVSPEDDTENEILLKEAGIKTYCYTNKSLGLKKNAGLRQIKDLDFDYLLELNSDDVIKSELLNVYKPYFKKQVKFLGIKNFAFYDLCTGKAKHLNRPTLYGIGRAYHKSVIPFLRWPDRNKGMDNYSEKVLALKNIYPTKIETNEPLAIDFKSKLNIWSYNSRPGKEISKNELFKGLSESELQNIDRATKRADNTK